MIRNRPTGRGSTPPDSFEFDRTLSPSDPGIQVAARGSHSAEPVVVRDSSVPASSTEASLREKETIRELGSGSEEPVLATTPSAASEYAPPQAAPSASPHKTIETELVQLDPEVHPRTAQTILGARRRARAAIDPGQVPTKPMPIQVRRARRRLARAIAAIACLGVGAVFAVLLQGASWGRGNTTDEGQVQSSRSPHEVDRQTATPREKPTLAVDVRKALRQVTREDAQKKASEPRKVSPGEREEIDPHHAAHLESPWADTAEAGSEPEQKTAQKRTVWLE